MRRVIAAAVVLMTAAFAMSLALAQTQPTQGDPPVASLISISAPDDRGVVTITGAAGAVFPSAQVAVRNLFTEQVVYVQAGITGSFVAQLFGPGNTPFWISPAANIPLERRNQPGSLPGGPGVIVYGAFSEAGQTTAPVTKIVIDGDLSDWGEYPQASDLALRNRESLYVGITGEFIPQDYARLTVTFTLNGATYAISLDPRLLQTATLQRLSPNAADLGTLAATATQGESAVEVRIPLAAIDAAVETAAANRVQFFDANGAELTVDFYEQELAFVDEMDGIVYPGGALDGDGVARFTVSGPLARGASQWTARGRADKLNLAPGDTMTLELDVTLTAPALPQSLVGLSMLGQIGLQPVIGANGVQAAGGLNSNNGWSSLRTPSGLAIDNLRGDFLLAEASTVPQQVVRRGDQLVFGLRFEVELPEDLPPGLYVPFFRGMSRVGDGDIFNWEDNGLFGTGAGISRVLMTRLPLVVNVGAIDSSRLTWTLFYDHPSDGSRGVLANEDAAYVALSNRVRYNSPTYILPPGQYPIEPYLLNQLPNAYDSSGAPLIPLLMPGGRLDAQVTLPDGSVDNVGTASIVQTWLSTNALDERSAFGTRSPVDTLRLTTLSPVFLAYPFERYGSYQVRLNGTVEDVWGNRYTAGGTYELLVAQLLDMTPGVLPGTPFEVGNLLYPGVHITPGLPAEVTVTVRVYPLDGSEVVERTFEGTANRFGYFHTSESFTFETPGEYVIDYEARYTSADGQLWAGSLRSAGVIGKPNSQLVAHGRRGLESYYESRPAWFNTREYPADAEAAPIVNAPYHSGDVAWVVDNATSGIRPVLDVQDVGGSYENWLLGTLPNYQSPSGERMARLAVLDELPLLSVIGGPGTMYSPVLLPELTVNQAYAYLNAVRAGVSVRQFVQGGDDPALNVAWDADDPLNQQIGAGVDGDRPGDFAFLFGGAVIRNAEARIAETAIYAALAVTTGQDDHLGTRVYPPFAGETGGANGGALLRVRGQDVSMFFHPTGAQPGQVFNEGETLVIAGQVAPTVAAKVSVEVTSPSGLVTKFDGLANAIGYFYDPTNDMALNEVGVWTVEIVVSHSGLTSAGMVEAPFPTGSVLGAIGGTFPVYVVPEGALPLDWERGGDIDAAVQPGSPVNFRLQMPADWTDTDAYYTVTMPGYILESGTLQIFGGSVGYQYSPGQLNQVFPNLEANPRAAGAAASDVVTVTFFFTGRDANGKFVSRSRTFTVMQDRLVSKESNE